jgi:outer membrane protein OmpA-like peptidoglycan-associated protein
MRAAIALFVAAVLVISRADATPTERVLPDGVLVFEPRSETWGPDDKETIDRMAVLAKTDSANWVTLEAYTNDLGGSEMNLALGQRRIYNIEREMALQGVPSHRIRGTSYEDGRFDGGELPMRRVEIRIQKLGL